MTTPTSLTNYKGFEYLPTSPSIKNIPDLPQTFTSGQLANIIPNSSPRYISPNSSSTYLTSNKNNSSDNNYNLSTLKYSPINLSSPQKLHDIIFVPNSPLTEKQKKFCSCYLQVGSKNYISNPFAICAKSIGTTSKNCGKYFDFNAMSDDMILSYLKIHNLKIQYPYNRQKALNIIYNSKLNKY